MDFVMDMPRGAIPLPDVAPRSGHILTRIAEATSVPIAEFLNPNAKNEVSGASELLTLWLAIKSEQGRYAALECLRAIAQDQAD
ncbi:hypothetical protein [Methylobacterium trifolii]|uniref:hypothetical protein n=1 Tax=Methylobacterium trifolii TaxID=1003092 RepID=UPI001EDE9386|nr:hypothetical protein [Methylobacterium trifolii]